MRKYFLTALAAVPFLFHSSQAAQSWNGASGQVFFGWPGDEAGTGAYLGVDVCDVTTDRLGALKLKEEKGVEVTMVDQDAPAGKAGIKEHDVILSVNGTAVESAAQLRRVIHETPAGRIVALGLSRDGQPLTLKTQLTDRSKNVVWAPKSKDFKDFQVNVMPSMADMPVVPDFDVPGAMVVVRSSARSGLTVENLTPQLGEFFGVKDGKGVLVRVVEKGSRAEKAGLRAGDVIVKINDQPVHDTTDFSYAMHRSRDPKGMSLGVVRDKHEQTLSMQQPENKQSGEVIEDGLGSDLDLDINAEDLDQMVDANLLANLQPQIDMASRIVADSALRDQRSACEAQQKRTEQAKILRDKIRTETQLQRRESQRKLRVLRKIGPLEI